MMPAGAATGVRIVLVQTQHPGNIGSTARAMKTMGLHDLVLVEPLASPAHRDALAMAAGAADVLAGARGVGSLIEAVADCAFVAGCTARDRHVSLPGLAPREAAARLREQLAHGPVALVFGCERTGLTNAELQYCHAAVHIPANPAYGSLNLAAAVQVLCYEVRLAMLASRDDAAPARSAGEVPVTQAQMEALFAHFEQALRAIDFHKGRAPDTVLRRLRALFGRAQPDAREVRILHGILADAERMARLAGQQVD